MISESLLGTIAGGIIGFGSSIGVVLIQRWITRPVISIDEKTFEARMNYREIDPDQILTRDNGETSPPIGPGWSGTALTEEELEVYESDLPRPNPIGGFISRSGDPQEPEEPDWVCKNFGGLVDSCQPGWKPKPVKQKPFHENLCSGFQSLFPGFCLDP